MSRTLTLPEDVADSLVRSAEYHGLSIEQLLAQWVAHDTPRTVAETTEGSNENSLVACTRALLDGTEPPIIADWDEIEQVLNSSAPPFPTVEEAMSAIRNRPWEKDSRNAGY